MRNMYPMDFRHPQDERFIFGAPILGGFLGGVLGGLLVSPRPQCQNCQPYPPFPGPMPMPMPMGPNYIGPNFVAPPMPYPMPMPTQQPIMYPQPVPIAEMNVVEVNY